MVLDAPQNVEREHEEAVRDVPRGDFAQVAVDAVHLRNEQQRGCGRVRRAEEEAVEAFSGGVGDGDDRFVHLARQW
jgi:hypothetical protein